MKKNLKVTLSVVTILIIIVGISYAYFTINLTGNEDATSTNISTANNLVLEYKSGREIVASNVKPGYEEIKTFTVENKSDIELEYNIYWDEEYRNEFVNKEDFVYRINGKTNGENIPKELKETPLPSEAGIIIDKIKIGAGELHTFTLTLEYKNRDYDQSSDMNKNFYGVIKIVGEGVEPKENVQVTVNATDKSFIHKYPINDGKIKVEDIPGYILDINSLECSDGEIHLDTNPPEVRGVSSKTTCTIDVVGGEYTVQFDANGGLGEMEPITLNYGEEVEIINRFTKEDYVFVGWSVDKYASDPIYTNRIKNVTTSREVKLYAIWKIDENKYKIKFDSNLNDGNSYLKSLFYEEEYELPEEIFERVGYEFRGWSTNSNSQNPEYVGLEKIKGIVEAPEKEITLYAIWRKELRVEFLEDVRSCYIYNKEESCEVEAPEIKRLGYEGIGWSLVENSKEVDVLIGEMVRVREDIKYYPITKKELKVIFKLNGATSISSEIESCEIYNEEEACIITTPSVTRAGYEVLGYSENENSYNPSYGIEDYVSIEEDKTLYVTSKKENPYIVSFSINDESNIYASKAREECYIYNREEECEIVAPILSSNAGFTAIGWSELQESETGELLSGGTKRVREDSQYYAISRFDTPITISFDGNGNTISSEREECYLYNGSSSCEITSPKITPQTNFIVIGFNKDENETFSEWNEETTEVVRESATYYAISKASEPIIINYIANGATLSKTSDTCTLYNAQTECTFTTPTITRSGYEILGFSTNQNGQASELSVETEKSYSTSTTYYAITRKEVTVTFNGNGNTISKESASCYMYNEKTSCSVTSPSITVSEGYEVIGFNKDRTAITSEWEHNTEKEISEDTTLYAIAQKENAITVSYVANGAVLSKTSDTCTLYNAQTECTFTSPTITRSGYEIIGWSTNQSGTDSELAVNTSKSYSENTTYYAITRKQINATFIGNGATLENETQSCYVYNTNTNCSVTSPTITRSGYTILGYNTSSTANSSEWTVGSSKTLIEDVTYYGVTSKVVTISFNGNGATLGSTSQSCTMYNTDTSCSVTSPTITRSGFTITGFGTNAAATANSWSASSAKSVSDNATYYAVTSKVITINFNANGATIGSTSQACTIQNSATSCNVTAPAITRSGYTIVGYNTTAGATTSAWSASTAKSVNANATYYAVTSKVITISFNANGATVGSTSQACTMYNTNTSCNVTSPTISRTNYTALGWGTGNTATASSWNVSTAKAVSANATYYAVTRRTFTLTYNGNGATGGSTAAGSCNIFNATTSCTIALAGNGFSKTNAQFLGWGDTTSSTGNLGTQTMTANKTIYARWQYLIAVNVSYGSVSPTSKYIPQRTTSTFTLTPNANYGNPTVSCTNGQSASISGNTLTTGTITNYSTCTVTNKLICTPPSGTCTSEGATSCGKTCKATSVKYTQAYRLATCYPAIGPANCRVNISTCNTSTGATTAGTMSLAYQTSENVPNGCTVTKTLQWQ